MRKEYLLIFLIFTSCSYYSRYDRPPTSEYSKYVKKHPEYIKYQQEKYNPTYEKKVKTPEQYKQTYIPSALHSQVKVEDIDMKKVQTKVITEPISNDYKNSEIKERKNQTQNAPTSFVQQSDEYDNLVSNALKVKKTATTVGKYRVKKGDTLYSIAKTHGMDHKRLADINGINDPTELKIGQELNIYADSSNKDQAPVLSKNVERKHKKSADIDNIYIPKPTEKTKKTNEKPVKITRKVTTDPSKVIKNISLKIEKPKTDKVIVKKGDTLYSIARNNNVPVKDLILRNNLKAPYNDLKPGDILFLPGSAYHIVQKGDTLYSIAKKYDVNLSSLAAINKIKAPYNISVSQKLKLPASRGHAAPEKRKIADVKQQKKAITKKTPPKSQKQIEKARKTQAEAKKKAKEQQKAKKQAKKKVSKYIPKPPKRSSSKFLWPLRGSIISSFGSKKNGLHNDGINIKGKKGDTVKAAENGIVVYSGNELKGMGNLVIIKHDGGYMTVYAHNDNVLVDRGTKVNRGQKIATVGTTGRVVSPQLHFEIRKGSKTVNPKKYLSK